MNENTAQKVNLGMSATLSMSLLVVMIGAIWYLATDRGVTLTRVAIAEQRLIVTETRLDRMESSISYTTQALYRIEQRMGTLPRNAAPPHADEP